VSATQEHPHINDVEPIGEADLECLREVRAVLQKHGKLERFGVQLLHSHFAVGDDEMFVEEVSVRDRTLTQRVFKIEEIELDPNEGLMTTAMDLIDEPTLSAGPAPRSQGCRYIFPPRPNPPHEHREIDY
jgi:hypothetical protein